MLRVACIGLLGVLLAPSGAVRAEAVTIESSYTLIGQTSDDRALDETTSGSLDLRLAWSRRSAKLEAYLEGSTSLQDDEIATRLPRSNADAGTALDAHRSGLFQLSELKYTHAWSAGRTTLSAGLLDPTVYLDSTRIDNDENQQFLGASFVNNPTIEFPDYTLGFGAGISPAGSGPSWSLLLTGSNGIADNPSLSYSQLLDVKDERKGLFAAAEAAWTSERHVIRCGSWLNTAEHGTLDGQRQDASNYGLYAAIGRTREPWAANLRLGAANREVSPAEGFASVSLQRSIGDRVVGLAASRTWGSPESPPGIPDYGLHFETYVRFPLAPDLYLTPSIQYLVNGGLDPSVPAIDDDVAVFSLRLHHIFYRSD